MKTYQLLRDNQQMGYFTKECLMQIGLQPMDLIWVVGESITWKYPYEIEDFKDFAPKAARNDATVVNGRKEQQIIYFRSQMTGSEYRKTTIQYAEKASEFEDEITPEFAYLLNPKSYKTTHTGVSADEKEAQEAVDAVKFLINLPFRLSIEDTQDDGSSNSNRKSVRITFRKIDREQKLQRSALPMGKVSRLAKAGIAAFFTGIMTFASAIHFGIKL